MIHKLFLLFSSLVTLSALADELVVVKAVSDSKKTFVIKKGFDEGIRIGQKRLFSTDKVSFVARATEVKNTLSLWEVEEKKGTVPFGYDDVVVITNSTESIWTDINRIKENLKVEANNKSISLGMNSAFVLKGSLSRGIAESADGTSTDIQTSRSGVQIEGLYSRALEGRIAKKFEIAGGARLDRDSTTMKSDTDFSILTTRFFLVGDVIYNFDPSEKMGGNFYASLGAGYGQSASTIGEATSVGSAFLLPSVKIGFSSYFENYQLIMEGGVEAMSAKENFTDGVGQRTTLISSKLTLGVRF